MTTIPTRWRTLVHDQLGSAQRRVQQAERHLADDEGGRALQEAYPAVVAGATIRVWVESPPWQHVMTPEAMHRQVQENLPSLFAALALMDVQQVLTSPWRTTDARKYVVEARSFIDATAELAAPWLALK